MNPLIVGVLGISALLLLLAAGVHIAFAMATVGFIGLLLTTGTKIALSSLELIPLSATASYTMVAIPLFVLMGNFAFIGGVTKRLFDVGFKWFGRLPGGLGMATTFASAGFAAATGSSVAMVAAMAKISLPEMDRYNYDRDLSLGTIAGAGTLGILIPPSLIAVLYAVLTDVSLGKILVAGFFPGILTAILFMMMIGIRSAINPHLGPRATGVSWKESFRSLPGVSGIVVIVGAVMGSIYLGVATPTEAASVGCLAALLIAALSRNLSWANLKTVLLDSIKVSVMIMTIVVGAAIFTLFLSRAGFAASFISLVTDLHLSPMTTIIIFLAMYIPLGMFFEPYSMLVLTLPITFPIIAALGIDGVWYGIMVIVMVEVSLLTPPVGLNVYVLKGAVCDTNLTQIFRSVIWFIIVDFIVVALLLLFPQIALFLPSVMWG
jgi:tripartite ATP-independent transporter DctM subunit